MTNTEIKKLYQQAKKAYEKRTGDKLTWVMNAKQQRLGTATIMCAMAWDYEERVMYAKRNLEKFETTWAERMAEYNKKAKEEAWKNEHKPGWYFGGNCTFWQDVVTNTEKLAATKAGELAMRERILAEETANLEEFGDYSKTRAQAIERAEKLIAEPEIQAFLALIGGQAVAEPKDHSGTDHSYRHTEMYVRFFYTAQ